MGFLQHDTNNIIIDAVLTDIGRKFLARNDGSFSIVKFALGDDEVDYATIQKYGRTVGKEKIEKNTPVFEALTNQAVTQKYRLISISNPNLIRLPSFDLNGPGLSATDVLDMGVNTNTTRTLTLQQTIQDEDVIDPELRDSSFEVSLDNRFVFISGNTPENIDNYQRARYILTADAVAAALGGGKLTFTLAVKSITNNQFTVYGLTDDKNTIETFVRVTGLNSGAVKEFTVSVTK